MFQSDFKIVADYFVQIRKNNNYVPSEQAIQHVDAVMKFLSAFTRDDRFYDISLESGREGMNMCEFLDRVEAKGVEKGLSQGFTQGADEKGICVFLNMIRRGYSREEAQSIAEISDELVEEALKR